MQANYLQRQAEFKARLEQQGYSAMLVLSHENIRYLSGFSGNAAYALITKNDCILITDYRYHQRAIAETSGFDVVCRDRDTESLGDCINRHLAAKSHVAFDASYITVAVWQDVEKALSNHTLAPVTGLIEQQRRVKDAWEVEQIKAAAAIADQALAETLPYFKEGVTERDLALELEYRMQKLGSEGMSFATIMLFAERTALPHGNPSSQVLKHGDFITLDFGAVVNGYRSDMTRSYILGEASDKQISIYKAVEEAQQASLALVKPGINCLALNAASQQVLDDAGYGEYAGKGLGHGLGLFLHEVPFINTLTDYTLEVGNVITIEPGIYIPGYGGVRLEDDIVVTDTGYEVLTHAPKPFII